MDKPPNFIDYLAAGYGLEQGVFQRRVDTTLRYAGLYILGYEMIKASVVDNTRFFFCHGQPPTKRYQDKVLARGPKRKTDREAIACLLWLKEAGGINDDEQQEIQQIRLHRNKLAHELPKVAFGHFHEEGGVDLDLLHRVPVLLDKIERFWVGIEMDVDGQEHEQEDYDNAVMLSSIVFAGIYYETTGRMPTLPDYWEKALEGGQYTDVELEMARAVSREMAKMRPSRSDEDGGED